MVDKYDDQKLFRYEKPIASEKDDILGRKDFSHQLGQSLMGWTEEESLVIGVYGDWGSGKSSVIKLALKYIENSNQKDKPTIIEFNPWNYTEEENSIGMYFFNEISKELNIKPVNRNDKKIAKKLRHYAKLLGLAPGKKMVEKSIYNIFILLGLFGILGESIFDYISQTNIWVKRIITGVSAALILIAVFRDCLNNVAAYFEHRLDYFSKTLSQVKGEVKNVLRKRMKKLVIVIDDIDRLNQSEIRQVFRLISINADFPNTIYLLAFDGKIIENSLEEQFNEDGKDYLEKIVQVKFNVPFAKSSLVANYLLNELNKLFEELPKKSTQMNFDPTDSYWIDIFNSGFKNLFKNLRDVKRFLNSLKFNLILINRNEILEVNPFDFVAIEAIRVFEPEFYTFMCANNLLFTLTGEQQDITNLKSDKGKRMDEINNELKKLEKESSVRELIIRLFPQITENVIYNYESQVTWNKNLRVCATENFYSYFTLSPGGGDDGLSQFEISEILSKMDSVEKFERILMEYVKINKIEVVLEKLAELSESENVISKDNFGNIIQTLFNISDDVTKEKAFVANQRMHVIIVQIIFKLFKQNTNKDINFSLLKDTIRSSRGLFGPFKYISLELQSDRDKLVPQDKISELQEMCIEKITDNENVLLNHTWLAYILARWREWDKKERWKKFVETVNADNQKLLIFIEKFINYSISQEYGSYSVDIEKEFGYKNLSIYIELDTLNNRLSEFRKKNGQEYQMHKDVIDLYLDNYADSMEISS